MKNEFSNKFIKLNLDSNQLQKIEGIIEEAGDEFPCLSCSSTNDCATFAWFSKWFGNRRAK